MRGLDPQELEVLRLTILEEGLPPERSTPFSDEQQPVVDRLVQRGLVREEERHWEDEEYEYVDVSLYSTDLGRLAYRVCHPSLERDVKS